MVTVQPPPGGILPHGAVLHRQSLLVVCGHAGIEAGAEHFRTASVRGQKPYEDLALWAARFPAIFE
jgi:hypothetical protein